MLLRQLVGAFALCTVLTCSLASRGFADSTLDFGSFPMGAGSSSAQSVFIDNPTKHELNLERDQTWLHPNKVTIPAGGTFVSVTVNPIGFSFNPATLSPHDYVGHLYTINPATNGVYDIVTAKMSVHWDCHFLDQINRDAVVGVVTDHTYVVSGDVFTAWGTTMGRCVNGNFGTTGWQWLYTDNGISVTLPLEDTGPGRLPSLFSYIFGAFSSRNVVSLRARGNTLLEIPTVEVYASSVPISVVVIPSSDPFSDILRGNIKRETVPQYQLVAYVNGVQVSDESGLKYPLAPSNIRAFGEGVVKGPATPVVVSCIDTKTGQLATDCWFQLHMDIGTSQCASDGGHKHRGENFERQPFEFDETDQTFPLDTPMPVDQYGGSLFYTPPEAAGDLILTITGWSDSTRSTPLDPVAPITFQVGVNGLSALPTSQYYRLTGVYPNTSSNPNSFYHPGNHYVTANGANIAGFAKDFFETFDATIGVNDASLEKGGIFDLKLDWYSPHGLHRLGNSVDVDMCAESTIPDNDNDQGPCPNGWITVPTKEFQRLCEVNGGFRVIEEPLHCEFSVNPEDL